MKRRTSLSVTISTILYFCILAVSSFTIIYCAGSKPGQRYTDDVPDDILRLTHTKYKESIYSIGTASGPDEGTAIRKAAHQARAEIAREFKSQVDALQKSYEESINGNAVDEYQQASEIFATLEISGSKMVKSMVRKENDGSYTAKALVVISAEQLQLLMDEKLKAYASFRASKAYTELQQRVKRERELQDIE